MLTTTRLTPQGKASTGADVLAYLKATEYYIGADGKERSSSEWVGKGAQALGLSGFVDIEVMDRVAMGFDPRDPEKALVQNAGDTGEWVQQLDRKGNPRFDENGEPMLKLQGGRVIGWDFTFSAPKSFSLLMASAEGEERDAVVEAHHKAVAAALEWLETQAEVRCGQGGLETQDVKGLVCSRHTHFGSRDLDPQLHSHVLIYNLAAGADDGRWRSLETQEMFRSKKEAGAFYRAALAYEIQKLGYGIVAERERDEDGKEVGDVYFHIAGVGKEMCDTFSKRRASIVAHMAEHGSSNQDATMATRKNKDEPAFAELDAMWRKAMDDFRRHEPTAFRSVEELKGLQTQALDDVSDSKTLGRLHETESVFTRSQLIGRLAREHVGRMSPADILKEADAFTQKQGVVAIAPENRPEARGAIRPAKRFRESRFAAQWVVDLEREVVNRAKVRAVDKDVRLESTLVDQAIARFEKSKGFSLSAEQRRAVRWVTEETGGVACISGQAGTGKTATAQAWVGAFQDAGRDVIGLSIGWDAAKKLQAEAGIQSHSVAAFLSGLDKGNFTLGKKSVVVLDEAGMAGTASVVRLQRHCDRAGAKLVLQGDALQLQPVEAGAAFRLALKTVGDRKLTEIRRQKSQANRDTANSFYAGATLEKGSRSVRAQREAGKEIFARLEEQRQVEGFQDIPQAMRGLVADYLASPTVAREKLIIGGTRAEVRHLNSLVRDGLRNQGILGSAESSIEAKVSGHTSTLALARGDRLRFAKKDESLGVVNGNLGSVQSLRANPKGGLDLVVKLESDIPQEDGRLVSFNTRDYNSLEHGYAMTVHKSQGQGRSEVYHLANVGMTDNHLALVAFTRAKDRYTLYGADFDLDHIASRFGLERLKENAIEAGVKKPRQRAPSTAPEAKAKRALATIRARNAERRRKRAEALPEHNSAFGNLMARLDGWVSKMRQRREHSKARERMRDRGRGMGM
ncbi:MAG: MobF family relaxase [Lysobacteraceae bacterium]